MTGPEGRAGAFTAPGANDTCERAAARFPPAKVRAGTSIGRAGAAWTWGGSAFLGLRAIGD